MPEELQKPKQKRPNKSKQMTFNADAGDNTKFTMHKLDLMNLPDVDTHDPEAVKQRIQEYFDITTSYDMKPSIESLAFAFGVSRKTIYNWTHGLESANMPDDCRKLLQRAYDLITSLMSDYMQNGKINPTAGIFLMTNNMDYRDMRNVVLQPEPPNPMGDQTSAEELQKRYLDAIESPAELPEKSAESE